jgi:hypothetical protein
MPLFIITQIALPHCLLPTEYHHHYHTSGQRVPCASEIQGDVSQTHVYSQNYENTTLWTFLHLLPFLVLIIIDVNTLNGTDFPSVSNLNTWMEQWS